MLRFLLRSVLAAAMAGVSVGGALGPAGAHGRGGRARLVSRLPWRDRRSSASRDDPVDACGWPPTRPELITD
jgi:hypothetical protein